MTVIKATNAAARRAARFPADGAASASNALASSSPPPRDIVADKVEQLVARVAELEAMLRRSEEEKTALAEKMRDEGRREGEAAASTRDRERLELLAKRLGEAVAGVESAIDARRDIAIEIARAALERLFADPELYTGMVAETARRQAAGLARGTVVALRVSAADFPDAAALSLLPDFGEMVRIETEADLPSGACLFDLRLGTLDASLPRQWEAIGALLDRAPVRAASA